MLFLISIISLYILVTLAVRFKNKATLLICMHFLSIELFLLFSILYIAKGYQYTPLFTMDTNIFRLLTKPNLSIYTYVTFIVFSIGIAMLSDIMLANYITKMSRPVNFLYCICIIMFIFFNLPEIQYNIMQRSESNLIYKFLYQTIKPVSKIHVILSLAIPIIYIIIYAKKTHIFYKKFSFNSTMISLFIVDLFEIMLFFIFPTKHITPWGLNGMSFPFEKYDLFNQSLNWDLYILISIIMIIAVCALTFIFLTKPMQFLSKGYSMSKKNRKLLNENTLMLFHAYKNAFWGISKLSEQALSHPQMSVENLKTINLSANESYEAICRAMKLISDFEANMEPVDVNECIMQAVDNNKRDNITFNVNLPDDKVFIKLNKNHLLEVFNNIFQNAAEAIREKKNDDGTINVNFYYEPGGVEIKIRDNGCGMQYSFIKKLFLTFGSTKHNNYNFGLGLNYVKSVMDTYNGDITIKSKYGQYTEVVLFLPLMPK